jgi:hypothetical protein
MIAFGAVERAKFESCRPRRDAGKPHASLAFGAAESLNCEQWDCGWVIGHCIPPLGQAGAQNSQSPVDAEEGGDGTNVLPLALESLVNIAQFLKIKWNATMLHFKAGAATILWRSQIALRHLASHCQNRADFFDLAAEDRFGGRSAQRGRDGPAIAPSAIALRRSQVPTGGAKLPPVPRPAYEGVPYSPAGLPLAG